MTSDGETRVLDTWVEYCNTSLALLPAPLICENVVPVRISPIYQRDQFANYSYSIRPCASKKILRNNYLQTKKIKYERTINAVTLHIKPPRLFDLPLKSINLNLNLSKNK